MKLLTKEIMARLPVLYANEGKADPMVMLKLFCPWGMATWLITEFDGEDTFFGWAILNDPEMAELGYSSLSEIQGVKGPFGLGIERDIHFKPKPLSEAKAQLLSSMGIGA